MSAVAASCIQEFIFFFVDRFLYDDGADDSPPTCRFRTRSFQFHQKLRHLSPIIVSLCKILFMVKQNQSNVNLFKVDFNLPRSDPRTWIHDLPLRHIWNETVMKQQWTVADSIIISKGAYCSMSVMCSPLYPLVQPLISVLSCYTTGKWN